MPFLRPNKSRKTASTSSYKKSSPTSSAKAFKKEVNLSATIELCSVKKEKDIEILKQFDLNIKFGPCYNVKRLDRWNWAKSRNLEPPEDVKQLIDLNQNDPDYTESIWYCYRSIL